MSEGTQSKQLPRWVEPRKMAQFGAVFQGVLPSESLIRLTDAVERVLSVSADLSFDLDEQGQKVMAGTVSAAVAIDCQRCMGLLEHSISAKVNLAIVWDESQAKSLSKEVDPWIVTEAEADLYAILEEELLLALPMVAYHDYACIDKALMSSGEEVVDQPDDSDNPFMVLAKLKKNQFSEGDN